MRLRLKLLACKVLYREISYLSCNNPHILDVTYLRQGYHNTPDLLRNLLQKSIDALDNGDDAFSYQKPEYAEKDFDAILLGYGLCSNALAGLRSRRYPLVVPRAHDCITLFLGSKEKYRDYFDSHKGGIYWYTGGWIDNSLMPGEERVAYHRNFYVEKYGEDNADYLMEMEQNWLKEYSRCAFVDWKELDNRRYIDYTNKCAGALGWEVDVVEGKPTLLEKMLSGDWDEESFLIVPPGKEIAQSYDETIMKTK